MPAESHLPIKVAFTLGAWTFNAEGEADTVAGLATMFLGIAEEMLKFSSEQSKAVVQAAMMNAAGKSTAAH